MSAQTTSSERRPKPRGSAAAALLTQGQSIWLDFITRDLIRGGELGRLIAADGIRGETSNPTIFEKAITAGRSYDEEIAELARHGADPKVIFEALAVTDVRDACDAFRPLYERTAGADGYVSIEVSPKLAHDASATVTEAKRLWNEVGRPNLMVKVPGTDSGAVATESLLAEGINVNITLLFSTVHHERVIQAHLGALERRVALGQPVDRLASVASFFVSRVDTLFDAALAERARTLPPAEAARVQGLMGKIGIANARIAYANFRRAYDSPRFSLLAVHGAHVQRPLWASTSVKNKRYPDVLYVESLVGPDTVDTMPLETLEALQDHGAIGRTVDRGLEDAEKTLAELRALGIDYETSTDKLEDDGIAAFSKSQDAIIDAIAKKAAALRSAS